MENDDAEMECMALEAIYGDEAFSTDGNSAELHLECPAPGGGDAMWSWKLQLGPFPAACVRARPRSVAARC